MADTEKTMADKKVQEETASEVEEFKVDDRRHWQQDEEADPDETMEPAKPTIIGEYRDRAEAAEKKLHEYIEAFKGHQAEQDEFRARLSRDVERKVELQFGELVGQLLATMDDLDLSLAHVKNVPEAEPLARGVAMARDRFLSILKQHGVEMILPDGKPFDPNDAQALRVDPVDGPDRDGIVTETLQAGYRLGDRVIRPAKVAVGRRTPS
jgi:molecular chaperone GrpE (heat shock protein)